MPTYVLLRNPNKTLLSNKCVSSALPGPRHIISLIKKLLTVLVLATTSSAISNARGSTCSGFSVVSVKRSDSNGWLAGYVAPVVTRCSALL